MFASNNKKCLGFLANKVKGVEAKYKGMSVETDDTESIGELMSILGRLYIYMCVY